MSPHSHKQIHIHTSVEEMDANRLRHAAALDPVEGLRQTVELILRVYGVTREDLRKRGPFKKITITRAG